MVTTKTLFNTQTICFTVCLVCVAVLYATVGATLVTIILTVNAFAIGVGTVNTYNRLRNDQ